jgi:hypothetical protein
MSTCGKITAGITHNCLDKLVQGLDDVAVLINIEDIDKDTSTFNSSNKFVLEQIVLKTASPALKGYKIEGYNFSKEHDTALVKRRFIDGWDHNFLFRIFDNNPDIKKFVNEAVDSRFVVIIKNKYNNKNATTAGNSVYEVLGWEHGLEIAEATRNPNDDETMGAWVLRATCDEANKEPYPPYTFFNTNLTTTDAAFAALYA